MATTTVVHKADSPTLKRAFASDLVPNTFLPSKKCEREFSYSPTRSYFPPNSPVWHSNVGHPSPRLGHRPTRTRRPSMVQTASRTFVPPMPSFMSVFGEEVSNTGVKELSGQHSGSPHGSITARPASSGNIPNGSRSSNPAFSTFHVHRDSTSTVASESSDNSPTTTISTMDSSSVTDPSPGPSPESPISKAAPPSFAADFRARRTENGSSEASPNAFFELQRPTTPAKKPRNLKNLGINTSTSLSNLRAGPTGSLPAIVSKEKNTSAPTSPSFIKPPTPPKRRPSNLSLTIQTPGSENKPMRLVIPSTPSFNRPALRHFQSSPSLPLCSPSINTAGGMKLPALRPIKTNPHGFAEVPNEAEEEDQEPNFDVPQSREEKPAAYPNGPICIYESGVYLYFEPTAEQAVTFDVIVNVASEVKNPFTAPSESQKDIDARRVDGPPAENPDFATLPERTKTASFDTQGSSPTTPKATPVLESTLPTEKVINGVSYKVPEYIHMMWEHNTDIVPDLYKLVKTMDERVQQGKRVLVHCQCGVSRSASLIVAYGIYKNPGISVQEAYDAVKKRSKWIGPNMNLIMQLQEFRNGLIRQNDQRTHAGGYGFPRRSAGLSTGVSTGTNRPSPFTREVQAGSRTPRTAPLPPDVDMNMQRASTGNMFAVSPGPLSAPSGTFFSPDFRRSWASSQTHFDLSPSSSPKQGPLSYVDPTGHVVPVLSISENGSLPAPQTESNNDQDMIHSLAEQKQSPVPNFSRQLPLRSLASNDGFDTTQPQSSEAFLSAPSQPFGTESLRSPIATGFNIPSRSLHDHVDSTQLFSPKATEFNVSPWPRDESAGPQSSPPMSPRSTEFHMTPLKHGEIDNSYGLLSPRGTSFDIGPSSAGQQQSWPADRSSQDFEVSSPIATEFPKDPFARASDAVDNGLQSPRAAEFHMTPLKPRLPNEDPFGLTSPKQFEFPSNPFDLTPPSNDDTETRRPSFQAILPPSHLAQPEPSLNGFLSLNGTAQAQPTAPELPPIVKDESARVADMHSRFDSLSTSESQTRESVEPITPPPQPESNEAWLSKDPGHGFLSTPSRALGIKTRFSSPNLREQRRLQKLQTEMESKLPNRSPQPLQVADDLDTLMSPRAEEFTRNPFHFDLLKKDEDTSPASSNETIKESSGRTEWQDPVPQFTPQKASEDPRSPVQTGSSPITRNIWDVL